MILVLAALLPAAGATPALTRVALAGRRPCSDPRVMYYVPGGSTQVYFSADNVTFAITDRHGLQAEYRRCGDRGLADGARGAGRWRTAASPGW
jgi:hypothetical protein